MNRLPRNVNESLLNKKDLFVRIFQGLIVSIAAFTAYYMYLDQDPDVARTIGISIILISNILLVQVNGSDSIIKNMKNKSVMIANIITILVLAIVIYSPINEFLKFSPLSLSQILLVIVIAMISVLWYELLKFVRRKKENI
jgi:Ca2+-transporting ATPase